MYKVTCLRPKSDFDNYQVRIPSQIEVTFCTDYDNKTLARACDNSDIIVAASFYPRIDKKLIENCRHLKLIQLTGAGFDTVDLEAAKQKGVWVANVPGANAKAVAEYTFLVAGMFQRLLLPSISWVMKGEYESSRAAILQQGQWEFEGRTFGIVGMGRIGIEVAKIAHFFGAKVLYHDLHRLPPDREGELAAVKVELGYLLEAADIIAIHLPLNEHTRGLIGINELKKMKKTAFLINVGRGGIVDENAIITALESGIIAGAALDTFVMEPLPNDHILVTSSRNGREKLLLTPHIAGGSVQSFQRMFSAAWDNVLRVARGDSPLNCITRLEICDRHE
ncbi:MAG: hypothetical protein KGZ96_00270 [Clostridia bacterium]|jgi:lactate dehydrogenase-like 2-hydroxyacid dehydrogenase|nr:hypothetical protein [Clostridia bacterium]